MYAHDVNALSISFPNATNAKVAMAHPTTSKKMMAPEALDEIIIHEIQHAIDSLNAKFNGGAVPVRACTEEQATATERAYVMEANKTLPSAQQKPVRNLYVDTSFILEQSLEAAGPFHKVLHKAGLSRNTIWGIKTLGNSESKVAQYVSTFAPKILLDAGCKGLSEGDLLARTRELLKNNDIKNADFSDVKMQQWIDAGLKKDKIGKYEPKFSK